ncbi:MIR motif-containing protein [Jimgerdemannia flammicorona]|uniref:MIR motif-containing protein n=1 Tax=Jimgerdemannia flammicorona TaxID=994334 RepID=A0A433QK93_9FUNG|nr:MIR motif-containing protein [Jimgerdemannia flammicorona]
MSDRGFLTNMLNKVDPSKTTYIVDQPPPQPYAGIYAPHQQGANHAYQEGSHGDYSSSRPPQQYFAPPPASCEDYPSQHHHHQQGVYHGTKPQGSHIRFGDHVALKHNMTGRYLSSRRIRYTTGSCQQQVFANRWQPTPSDFWIVIPALGGHHSPGESVHYNQIVRLKHVETRSNLHSHRGFASPSTSQQEVTAFGDDHATDENDHWRVERFGYGSGEQPGGEWQVDDVFILRHVSTGLTLHSHDARLGHEDINEVTAFGPDRDENDKWRVIV